MTYRKILNGMIVAVSMIAGAAFAQSAAEQTAIAQQQAAIQNQITQGITSGSLSPDQIAALQAQSAQLGQLQAQGANTAATRALQQGAIAQPGLLKNETYRSLSGNAAANTANTNPNQTQPVPSTTRTSTGPDPFTYNTLGPDAYQAQKYQNPGYNVPAYPTTQPQPEGTQQLTSGASAGTPYGAGTAQAPGAGGALPQVYVYHPGSGMR